MIRGGSRTKIYKAWSGMRQRCENPNHPMFHLYGGVGISVCSRWESFDNFISDMGERPPGHSIDRIDGKKGYSVDNCRWALPSAQARNISTNRLVIVAGRVMCLKDACSLMGVSYDRVIYRTRRGLSPQAAFDKVTGQ